MILLKDPNDELLAFNQAKELLGTQFIAELGEHKLNKLHEALSEPWRYYHNWSDHVLHMLNWLSLNKSRFQHDELTALQLMAIYHDAFYRIGPRATSNEQESAMWAAHDIDGWFSKRTVQLVYDGILATEDHLMPPHIVGGDAHIIGVFLDLDLMVLGAEPQMFVIATEKIWREYQPMYTRDEFNAGRRKWAFTMYKRELYFTGPFQENRDMAKENLATLL